MKLELTSWLEWLSHELQKSSCLFLPHPTTPHWSYRHALWYPTSYTGSGDLNSGTQTSRPSHLPSQSLCFLDQHLPQGCASKTCPWVSARCTVIGNCPEAYNLADLTGSAMDTTSCLMSLKSSLLRTTWGRSPLPTQGDRLIFQQHVYRKSPAMIVGFD